MCSGGGGSAATITMPDTGAYNRLANDQMRAMEVVKNDPSTKIAQAQLDNALLAQQRQLEQLRDVTMQRANNTATQAARLSQLIGTPPPEKVATAPVVGDKRELPTTRGKSALRIEQAAPPAASSGAGLNIT